MVLWDDLTYAFSISNLFGILESMVHRYQQICKTLAMISLKYFSVSPSLFLERQFHIY